MQLESPRQFARAWETLAGRKVITQNAEHDLRHQLFANANVAAACEPELHGRNILLSPASSYAQSRAGSIVNSLSPQLPLLTLLHYDDRMSFGETIFLFFLALIIFGPKKLPEIARTVGKYLNEFKRAPNESKAQIEQEISHLDTAKPQILTPTLSSSSWAGDSHTTEGLAPEGTASRSLTSTGSGSVGGEQATPGNSATLAAPLSEDSNTHENTSASPPLRDAAEIEVAPISDAVTDSDKTHSAQESHA